MWDYADKTELMRYFWDVVVELEPSAGGLDEGRRFPLPADGYASDKSTQAW